MKRIFPSSFYNLTTLIGIAVVLVSLGVVVFFALLEATAENSNPYMGIIAFVIVPIFLLVGIFLMAIGVWREHRRERMGKPHGLRLPQIDLNNPRHRTAVTTVLTCTLLLLFIIGF